MLTVAIPFLRRKEGTKILIGDNLSSHLSVKIVEECGKYNIKFVFLPANSTDKTQPLDVAFYAPLKRYWRGILSDWKLRNGKKETSVPKASFPDLLTKLLHKISDKAAESLKAGFEKCGIIPLDRKKVLERLPLDTNAVDGQWR